MTGANNSRPIAGAGVSASVDLTAQQLLLDLRLAFPGLGSQLLPGDTPLFPGDKICFQNQVTLPDGRPVYLLPEQNGGRDAVGYSQRINDAFTVWLAERGWQVFCYRGALHLIVPTRNLLQAAVAQSKDNPEMKTWCDENLREGSELWTLVYGAGGAA